MTFHASISSENVVLALAIYRSEHNKWVSGPVEHVDLQMHQDTTEIYSFAQHADAP